MHTDTLVKLVGDGLGLILVPWCVWVTASLYNQRQEIALLKQAVDDLKAVNKVLIKALGKEGLTA